MVVAPEADTTDILKRVKRHRKVLHMRNYRSKLGNSYECF